MKPSLKFRFLIPVLLLVFAGFAAAQDQYSDPPTRVARLQFMDGQVSLQPGGVDDWAGAAINRPLTTADRLWVDRDSRAELSLGTAALRLGSETSISFTNLGDNVAQLELDQGTLEVSVRSLNPGELFEIDTPNIAFTANEPGVYRVDVNPDEGRTWVTVRRGSGTATGQQASALLERGQLYEFSNGDSGEYTVADAMPRDDFEAWCFQRERRETDSISRRYVAPGTIGVEALDDAGDWQPMPTYGTVWFPRVSAGWAPYQMGHWVWVEPWGWTWVDDEPWGFAPFHYGRWAFISGRWGWIPGPREARPVYAPALVAWIGGPSFGISIGIGGGGGVGWVPLGWHDPYIPTYHVSPRYAQQVNITNTRVVNTTIINNYYSTTNVNVRNTTINNIHYENVRVQNAVTVVPSNALASGRPVQQVAVRVQPQQITRVMVSRAPDVVPTKQAVLGPHPVMQAPARLVVPRQVVAKTPPPPPPVSFDRQRPLLEQQKGMPLLPQQRATLRQSMPAAPARPQPPVVTVKPTTPKAPPMANKPATPPKPPALANVPPRPGAPGAPAPAMTPGRPAQPEVMTPGRPAPPEAMTPGRPAPPATRPGTPAMPQGREVMPGRPEAPTAPAAPQGREVMPARPAAPPAGRESMVPERPMPPARPAAPATPAPPQGREFPPARPATPASPAERPGFAGRPAAPPERPSPAPQERPMERPMPPSQPAPQERTTMPNQPSRPAPEERGMMPQRPAPAPPQRPTPPSAAPQERTMERPAPRPATPPAREAAPEQQRKTPPPKENPKDQKDKNNPER